MTNTVFTDNSAEQEVTDAFVLSASEETNKEIEKAKKILDSSQVLFTSNAFPAETSDAQKEVLKNSLIALSKAAKEAKKSITKMRVSSIEKTEKCEQEKQGIEQQFQIATGKMANDAEEKKKALEEEKNALETELKKIKEEYEAKKSELEEKRKEIISQQKGSENSLIIDQKVANNARTKALEEVEKKKALPREEIQHAAGIFEHLQESVNRATGSFKMIFSNPNQAQTLQEIIDGKFSAAADIPLEETENNNFPHEKGGVRGVQVEK